MATITNLVEGNNKGNMVVEGKANMEDSSKDHMEDNNKVNMEHNSKDNMVVEGNMANREENSMVVDNKVRHNMGNKANMVIGNMVNSKDNSMADNNGSSMVGDKDKSMVNNMGVGIEDIMVANNRDNGTTTKETTMYIRTNRIIIHIRIIGKAISRIETITITVWVANPSMVIIMGTIVMEIEITSIIKLLQMMP